MTYLDFVVIIGGGTQRASRKKLNYLAGQYNQAKLNSKINAEKS